MEDCPECQGKGVVLALGCGPQHPVALSYDCELCGKTGKIDEARVKWREAGRRMKAARVTRGIVLREEANRRGVDVVVLSKMERGIVAPVEA